MQPRGHSRHATKIPPYNPPRRHGPPPLHAFVVFYQSVLQARARSTAKSPSLILIICFRCIFFETCVPSESILLNQSVKRCEGLRRHRVEPAARHARPVQDEIESRAATTSKGTTATKSPLSLRQ